VACGLAVVTALAGTLAYRKIPHDPLGKTKRRLEADVNEIRHFAAHDGNGQASPEPTSVGVKESHAPAGALAQHAGQ
jgi:hypothetical protein